MILKNLSVLVASAALLATVATPIAAQGTASGQNQTGKTSAKTDSPQPQQLSRPKPWWLDENSKKELGLTAQQVTAIDEVYNSSKDELAGYRENMDRERKELDRLIAESKVEQWVVLRHIDKTEVQRSSYNKTFWMMLYRMNRALTPEQRIKLQQMERRSRGGRGGDRRDPKPTR